MVRRRKKPAPEVDRYLRLPKVIYRLTSQGGERDSNLSGGFFRNKSRLFQRKKKLEATGATCRVFYSRASWNEILEEDLASRDELP